MGVPQSNPGYVAQRTVTPRRVIAQAGKDREILIDVILDGTNSYDAGQASGYEKYLRGGAILAYSGGKWAPCKRTKANGAGSAATALVVDSAIHFQAGDSVIVGSNAAQAIVSVDSATEITLTSAISWDNNSPVYVAAWSTGRAILVDDEVALRNYENTANADQTARATISAFIDKSQVLGDLAAILEDPESARFLDEFIFDDYQDGTTTLPYPFTPLGSNKIRHVGGNLTVTAEMSGTLFVATAAATFTLPTKAVGLHYEFYQTADANLVVASAAGDDIVIYNDAAADNLTYSTTSQKIGAHCAVAANQDATKWLGMHLCSNTLTVNT